MTDELYTTLEPVLATVGLELFDVELRAGVLLVTVERPGGVDLDALVTADRAVSVVLDQTDPLPGRYTLEVSSPGVERTLRRPAHFAKAVGETVTVKTRPQVPGERRRRGTLVAADELGFELEVPGGEPGRVRLAYGDVDRVRTVFEWGPGPRPGSAGAAHRRDGARPQKSQTAQKDRKQAKAQTGRTERKQVATP